MLWHVCMELLVTVNVALLKSKPCEVNEDTNDVKEHLCSRLFYYPATVL